MKVLILTDELFATRERAMIGRVELGLADDGFRVIHAMPAGINLGESGPVVSRYVPFETSPLAAFRRIMARRLAMTIADPDAEEDDQPVSVVHVFGGSVWDIGQEIASELEAELVLELWRPALIDKALRVASSMTTGSPPVFTVPDVAAERHVRERCPRLTVRATPWGVHVEDPAHLVLPQGRSPAAVMIGSGQDRPACIAALTGLAQVIPTRRDLMIFIDARMVRRGDLWPVAKKLGLLPSLSLIQDIEARRDLLTQADLLILPEARGEHHSVVLEAMAAPMAVIAADDSIGAIIHERTALLVARPDAATWSDTIRGLLSDPARANALANSAREYVRQERTVFRHVRGVIELYQWMTSPSSIPIRSGHGRAEGPGDDSGAARAT
ncbi:MAG: glycosyltransferase [Phycisphaeraceae bacterium]|nr:glycosyltransferase [Phycisphaerae bacterium]MBX3393566.1 glycosyltransferase [Phycisphaeraceae bacterium]